MRKGFGKLNSIIGEVRYSETLEEGLTREIDDLSLDNAFFGQVFLNGKKPPLVLNITYD